MPDDKHPEYTRYALIDLIRGFAIFLMFVFHFSWDLNNFKIISIDFHHNPFWLNFRTLIVTTFLCVMGISLFLAHRRTINMQGFLRRLSWLIGCAILITVSTYYVNGDRFIYFGILHFIALASILAIPFIGLYRSNLLIGISVLAIGNIYQNDFFNPRYLSWIGFVTEKPLTDDYVPLFPWFGVVLLGIFAGRWIYSEQRPVYLMNWQNHSFASRTLQFAGRHSLIIYMLHQPVFIGILSLLR